MASSSCRLSCSAFVKYLDVLEQQDLSLDWQVIGIFCVLGVLGTFAGGSLANRLPQEVLRKIFAIVLIVMAPLILWKELVLEGAG